MQVVTVKITEHESFEISESISCFPFLFLLIQIFATFYIIIDNQSHFVQWLCISCSTAHFMSNCLTTGIFTCIETQLYTTDIVQVYTSTYNKHTSLLETYIRKAQVSQNL